MRERFRSCFSPLTLTVGAFMAGACELPEDFSDAGFREGEQVPPGAEPPPEVPGSLSAEDLPPIIDLATGEDIESQPGKPAIIKSRAKAAALGKALFWDMQAGSDGQACASCHFAGGADPRARNQLSPGLLGGNEEFDETRSGKDGGPNYMLTADDFPFHVKKDPNDRRSKVLFDTDDVASSQGVFLRDFAKVKPGDLEDICEEIDDEPFQINDNNLRRVEPRNTPTVINAAFNFRNFWDGRANRVFNGVDPFGPRNEDAFVLAVEGGDIVKREIRLLNSSLASQAVGPILSEFEMSCAGRRFQNVAQKLLKSPTRPLAFQEVRPDDSLLGGLASSYPTTGLNLTYAQLIEEAFEDRFWDSTAMFDANKKKIAKPAGVSASKKFTLMETNFSLFWGLAIQEYERTLISANTPFDRYQDGDTGALSPEAAEGLKVFMGQGKCVNCHGTAMFTNASTLHLIPEDEEGGLVERMLMSEEQFHYAVETHSGFDLYPGSLGMKGKKSERYEVSLDVEGTPTLEGGTIAAGDAQGSIRLTQQTKDINCKYSPTSMTFGVDKTKSRDARIEATRTSGKNCPKTLRISVADDLYLGDDDWLDFMRIDDGAGGFVHSGFVKATHVTIRQPALYDSGFYNIGVRPTKEDLGVGGKDPFGNPLSFTEQYVLKLLGKDVPDDFDVDPCKFTIPWVVALDGVLFPGGFTDQTSCGGMLAYLTGVPEDNAANERFIKDLRRAVKGAFKTATLRNVQLTAPYMHNGGMSTLEQVVEFYNRGGNFPNNKELDPDITRLDLTMEQRKNLVAFLESLTDPDVVFEREPFDHPQLFVPNGLKKVKDSNDDDLADENLFEVGLELPAVGKGGRDEPITTFLNLEDLGAP